MKSHVLLIAGLVLFISCSKEAPTLSEPTTPSSTDIPVTQIILGKTAMETYVGHTEQISIVVNPDNATNPTVKWTSSNDAIVIVDDKGNVTGKGKGKATITAQADHCKATSEITVYGDFIAYTTTDGNIAKVSETAFGVPFFCNVYESGQGKIVLKDTPSSVGGNAFEKAANLKTIAIPEGVTAIGDWAFNECAALESVTIPNSLITIGTRAFSSTAIKSLSLPSTIESLGIGVFMYCPKLESIVLPGSLKDNIGDHLFKQCSSLKTVTLSSGITAIPWATFIDCVQLEKVDVPDTVSEIGESAFAGCESLKSIHIPNQIVKLRDHTFDGCSSLAEITRLDNLEHLGNYAFNGCSSLRELYLGENTNYIGNGYFAGSVDLHVYLFAITPPFIGGLGGGQFRFYVPAEALDAYREEWGLVGENYVLPIPE